MSEWRVRVEFRSASQLHSVRTYDRVEGAEAAATPRFTLNLVDAVDEGVTCEQLFLAAMRAQTAPARGSALLFLVRSGIVVASAEFALLLPAPAPCAPAPADAQAPFCFSCCGMPAIAWALDFSPGGGRDAIVDAIARRHTAWLACTRAQFSCVAACAEREGTHRQASHAAPDEAPLYVLSHLTFALSTPLLSYLNSVATRH